MLLSSVFLHSTRDRYFGGAKQARICTQFHRFSISAQLPNVESIAEVNLYCGCEISTENSLAGIEGSFMGDLSSRKEVIPQPLDGATALRRWKKQFSPHFNCVATNLRGSFVSSQVAPAPIIPMSKVLFHSTQPLRRPLPTQ